MRAPFPLLEQLRAERERHEAEIGAPFVSQIDGLARLNRWLRERNQDYSRLFSSGIEDRLLDAIRRHAADQLAPMVMNALSAKPNEPVTVTVTLNDLRFGAPDQFDRALLMKAREAIQQQIEATVEIRRGPFKGTATEQRETFIRFHIPPLTVEVPVACPRKARNEERRT
jgi:hypothetical protein